LLGVLKYPVPLERVVRRVPAAAPAKTNQLSRNEWKPPKGYMGTERDVVSWILEPFSAADQDHLVQLRSEPTESKHGKSAYNAFDTSIMELADDIAYGVHDLEDAISLRLITYDDWADIAPTVDPAWGKNVDISDAHQLGMDLFRGSGAIRKRGIGCLVNAFVVSIEVRAVPEFENPLLCYKAVLPSEAGRVLDALKDIVIRKVIKTPQVQTLEYRGQQLIVELFEALSSDPERLLKDNFRELYSAAADDAARSRVLCDYIAGMTDEYATRMFERLFLPRHGLFSDRL